MPGDRGSCSDHELVEARARIGRDGARLRGADPRRVPRRSSTVISLPRPFILRKRRFARALIDRGYMAQDRAQIARVDRAPSRRRGLGARGLAARRLLCVGASIDGDRLDAPAGRAPATCRRRSCSRCRRGRRPRRPRSARRRPARRRPPHAPPAAAPAASRPTLVPNPGDPANVDEVMLPGKPAAILSGTSTWDDGFTNLKNAFRRIEEELTRAGHRPGRAAADRLRRDRRHGLPLRRHGADPAGARRAGDAHPGDPLRQDAGGQGAALRPQGRPTTRSTRPTRRSPPISTPRASP